MPNGQQSDAHEGTLDAPVQQPSAETAQILAIKHMIASGERLHLETRERIANDHEVALARVAAEERLKKDEAGREQQRREHDREREEKRWAREDRQWDRQMKLLEDQQRFDRRLRVALWVIVGLGVLAGAVLLGLDKEKAGDRLLTIMLSAAAGLGVAGAGKKVDGAGARDADKDDTRKGE